jgi:glyoxylase-like metal-dependent hydrolase (beta-lactamase superfamily II)
VKLTDHGGHLLQATVLWSVNCHLVREDDGLTLIDTLVSPRNAPDILRAAEDLDAPIVRIAITHAHWDHVGALDALASALPDAEVAFGEREARFLAGDRSLDADEPAVTARSMMRVRTRAARLLRRGDRLGSLEVVPAPGHTPGQIAFLDTRDRTLIAGDAFSTLGGTYVTAKINPRFPLPTLGTWHRPTALRTARQLRELDPSRLAVGHGRVIEDPGDEMDRAIAAAM